MATEKTTKKENLSKVEYIMRFLEQEYKDEVLEIKIKDNKYLEINFIKLIKFDTELGNYLLEHPEDAIKTFDIAVGEIDEKLSGKVDIRITNAPKDVEIRINGIRKKDLNKLVVIKGMIVTRTEVYPRVTLAKFNCPKCNNTIIILQTRENFQEPNVCSCGNKGGFYVVHEEYEDTIIIKIEDLPEKLIGSEQPRELRVILKRSLCKDDYKLNLGARIQMIGWLSERKKLVRGKPTVNCDYILNVIGYTNLDYIDFDTNLTDNERELFNVIKSKSNPANFISKRLYPDICGHTKAKECLIYQNFGGTLWNGKRDFMHILQFGDPGTAKTDMAIRAAMINPISRVDTGPNISNVGLTAAARKDELTGKWSLAAGLLPRCNKGTVVIDEMDKMGDKEKKGLHTPMEHGICPISKAGISADLVAYTSISATSNPKNVNGGIKVSENCDLPSPILDRFDLIFIFKDVPNKHIDEKICFSLVNRATIKNNNNTFRDKNNTFEYNGNTFHITTLKKYVYLSKKYCPKLSIRASNLITSWYSGIRQQFFNIGFEQKKPSPRVVESILRMARAISRAKMKDKVTIKELQLAMSYFESMYNPKEGPFVVEEESVE